MDMIALLDRISARAAALKLSESELSMAAGSRDLIRNWRRAAREGREIQARHSSLADIAAKLGVSTAWLIEGDSSDDDNNPTQPAGFAEPIASFEFRPTPPRADDPEPIAAIRAVMAPGVSTPATFEVREDMPWLSICRGDILVVDLSRLAKSGDLALASIATDSTENTAIVRVAEPWAIEGPGHAPRLHHLSSGQVNIRYPVVGLIRKTL